MRNPSASPQDTLAHHLPYDTAILLFPQLFLRRTVCALRATFLPTSRLLGRERTSRGLRRASIPTEATPCENPCASRPTGAKGHTHDSARSSEDYHRTSLPTYKSRSVRPYPMHASSCGQSGEA